MNFFHQSNRPPEADQEMSQQPSVVPVYVSSNSQQPQFHQRQSLRPSSQDAFSQLQIPLHQPNPPQSAPQNLESPAMSSFDLGDLSVPELLNAINPDLIEYFQSNTPQVLSALMEQDNRNHHLTQNTASIPTHHPQVLTDDNNSNVSSYLSEVASPPHSISSRESLPRSNILPFTSAPQLTTHPMPAALNRNPPGNPVRPANPAPAGAAAAVAAAAAAASAAASAAAARHTLSQQPQVPVMSNVRRNHPMVSVQHPHVNPNHPQLHPAARQPQFSPARPGMTLDQQAALNAAARARVNPASAQLNSKQIHRMSHDANALAARQALQSRPHSASAHPQLSAHQPRMTPVSSAPMQNPVATMSTPVLTPTMSPSPSKAKPADRRSKNRTRDPQRATVKREDTKQSPSSSLKRPAPSSRSDASASTSPSNMPAAAVSAAAVPAVAMSASQLQQMPVKMEDPSIDDIETGEEDVESKKAMRAERNRQSAAASRERRKHHIKELERRVKQLSRENAALQVEQLITIQERIEKEKKLVEENTELKKQVIYKTMEISKLSHELEKVRVRLPSEDPVLKRPSTWDAAEWKDKLKIRSR